MTTKDGDVFYSNDGESYTYSELEDAAQDILEFMEDGDTAFIYKGEAVAKKGSDFFPYDIFERIGDQAYEDYEDFTDNWLCNIEQRHEKGLRKALGDSLDAYLKQHDLEPEFFGIANEEKIKIKCIDYPDLDKGYRLISSDQE